METTSIDATITRGGECWSVCLSVYVYFSLWVWVCVGVCVCVRVCECVFAYDVYVRVCTMKTSREAFIEATIGSYAGYA